MHLIFAREVRRLKTDQRVSQRLKEHTWSLKARCGLWHESDSSGVCSKVERRRNGVGLLKALRIEFKGPQIVHVPDVEQVVRALRYPDKGFLGLFPRCEPWMSRKSVMFGDADTERFTCHPLDSESVIDKGQYAKTCFEPATQSSPYEPRRMWAHHYRRSELLNDGQEPAMNAWGAAGMEGPTMQVGFLACKIKGQLRLLQAIGDLGAVNPSHAAQLQAARRSSTCCGRLSSGCCWVSWPAPDRPS